jgi:hypothetical protein
MHHAQRDAGLSRAVSRPPAAKFHVIENGYDEDEHFGADRLPCRRPERAHHAAAQRRAVQDRAQSVRLPGAHRALKAEGKMPARTRCAWFCARRATSSRSRRWWRARRRRHRRDRAGDSLPRSVARDAVGRRPADLPGQAYNTQIPAKIYEYFRARRPDPGTGRCGGETARVLRAAGFDSMVAMDQPTPSRRCWSAFIDDIAAGRAYVASDELVASSSRVHRAGQLAGVLNDAAFGSAAAPAKATKQELPLA